MATVPASGASPTLTITTTRDCTWSVTTTALWTVLPRDPSGQGNGTLEYQVLPNGAPSPRRATIDVNGTQVPVAQDAAPCRFTVTPPRQDVGAAGGTVTVRVETLTGCGWSATTTVPWLTIASGSSGNGNGTTIIRV
jgi:hypothetical protein